MPDSPATEPPLGRRARQAQQTRADILQAARRLFAENGYAGTTVRQIATAAGVSAQTVYDSVGSKQELVARLNDLIDQEADIPAMVGEVMASGDPAAIIGLPARITRSIFESCGDIIRTLTSGAASEPALAAVVDEGHRRHLGGVRGMVGALQRAGVIGPDADLEAISATVAVLADVHLVVLLHDAYGWSPERIEAWIVETTTQLLGTDTRDVVVRDVSADS